MSEENYSKDAQDNKSAALGLRIQQLGVIVLVSAVQYLKKIVPKMPLFTSIF